MSPANEATSDLVAELRRHISGDVHSDAFTRTLYSTDASIYQIEPLGVVIPRNHEDVLAAVEIAARHRVPVLPRGSGSSLAGQTVGTALVIDFSRHLDQLFEVNTEENWALVQPGMVLDAFNKRVAPLGLQYGPDPASSDRATFGGMMGNNSAGSHSILYGLTVDHIQDVSAVLSDGTAARFGPLSKAELAAKLELSGMEGDIYRGIAGIVERNEDEIKTGYPKTWRRVSGYNLDRLVGKGLFNLASLITGSEGTLATVTEMRVGLVPLPKRTALLVIHFDDLIAALGITPRLLEMKPSAVELMDGLLLGLTRSVPAYARHLDFVQGQPEALLMVEVYGEDERELNARLDALEVMLKREGVSGAFVRATDPAQIASIWYVRKVGLGLLMGIKGDFKPIPFIEDAAVPVEHLAEYIERVQNLAAEHDTRVAYYAHASAGVVHVRPLINLKNEQGVLRMQAIAEGSFEMVAGYGGAISGEHGDGLVRSMFNEQVFGPTLYQAFREVKSAFDPHNVMNPGKVVDAPAMTESLRYGPDYHVRQIETTFDFSVEHGYDRAIEMCNGAGVCRRVDVGTMCPSFHATRQEEHSTRGRANLLRAAISGLLPPETYSSQRMFEALDLCLECKACQAECPSGVDMAKLKAEWLSHYYAEQGVPLGARVFANIHTLNRIGSAFAPLSNWVARLAPVRWLVEKTLGVDRRRTLPEFTRQPFDRWFRRREVVGQGSRGKVLLFHDTFMTYNEPQIGVATTELLEAAGFEVILAEGRKCCGRPMISKGLLKQAKANAEHNVELLAGYARQGIPIVGCEPSCILTIRDDYLGLVPGDEAQAVADNTYTLEEFLSEQVDTSELFGDEQAELLLHGHCHQKALIGTGPALNALGQPSNYSVQEIPSGCCGMAGSFGYEQGHYELSEQIGELSLLPAVRDAGDDVQIVAAGMSCRQQIAHFTQREARHPALVLREALLAKDETAGAGR